MSTTPPSSTAKAEFVPYASFDAFYPFYLGEHSTRACKTLHFVGATAVILLLAAMALTGRWTLFWLLPIVGYGFAWVGHFVFEKNRPASFKQPLYSLRGDFVMWWHLLTGKLGFATGAPLRK
jgi:hypothetical protein